MQGDKVKRWELPDFKNYLSNKCAKFEAMNERVKGSDLLTLRHPIVGQAENFLLLHYEYSYQPVFFFFFFFFFFLHTHTHTHR